MFEDPLLVNLLTLVPDHHCIKSCLMVEINSLDHLIEELHKKPSNKIKKKKSRNNWEEEKRKFYF